MKDETIYFAKACPEAEPRDLTLARRFVKVRMKFDEES
jgi:hypothetical protein